MRCIACQYDLRGLTTGVCPECGRGFDPGDARTIDSKVFRSRVVRMNGRAAIALASLPLVLAVLIQLTRVLWRIEHGHWPVAYIDDPGRAWWRVPFYLSATMLAAGMLVSVPVVPSCLVYVSCKCGARALRLVSWCALLGGTGAWLLWMDFFRASAWIAD